MRVKADTQRGIVRDIFAQSIALHQRAQELDPAPILAAAAAMERSLARGGKILAFGNGGSAADAQHFAAELVGRFARERQGLAAVSLSADTSILTSIGNDYGFDRVFARQVEAIGRAGDVAFAISTSGRSTNVLAAVDCARDRGLTIVALTGRDGSALGRAVDIHINVPDESTPRVQEVHRTILHIMCELIEATR